jgi:hypothetical protein
MLIWMRGIGILPLRNLKNVGQTLKSDNNNTINKRGIPLMQGNKFTLLHRATEKMAEIHLTYLKEVSKGQ